MPSKRIKSARASPLSCLACLLLSAHVTAAAAELPTRVDLDGHSYDLSTLSEPLIIETTHPVPPSVNRYRCAVSLFASLPVNPDVPAADQCPAQSRICMSIVNEKEGQEPRVIEVVGIAGDYGDAGSLDIAVAKAPGTDGLLLTYSGGRYLDKPQRAEITLRCKADAADPSHPEFADGTLYTPEEGLLRLTWDTVHACPDTVDAGPPPGSGDEAPQASRSVFTIFFWLVLLGFTAYLAIGAWIQRSQYGATGADMLPNRDFWRDLPYVIKEALTPSRSARAGYSSLG